MKIKTKTEEIGKIKITESIKNTSLVLNTGGQVRMISTQSQNNVGKRADLLIMDEVQDIELSEGERLKRALIPMLNVSN